MLCDFFMWISSKLLYLFYLALPSAPSGYINFINYINSNIGSWLSNLFFLDGPFIGAAFSIYIDIIIVILSVYFIFMIIKLVRG
jgi:hypothetical protein